jgi:hypothetical protein
MQAMPHPLIQFVVSVQLPIPTWKALPPERLAELVS